MSVHNVVISGTGLYTPANSISNDELVASFNAYVQQFNADNAEAIARGEIEALSESSTAFIEKASGIKSRFVIDKDGILDPQRMVPRIPERSNDEWGILKEAAFPQIDDVVVASRNASGQYLYQNFFTPSGEGRVTRPSLWQIRVGLRYTF